MAPVLLGLLLAIRHRPVAAAGALAIAAGVKIWPLLLVPLVLRPLLCVPRRLAAALALVVGLTALWAWPIVRGGLDEQSGFVAYATLWQTNSAYFPVLQRLVGSIVIRFGAPEELGGLMLRLGLALACGGLALWLARRLASDAADLLRRAGILAAALVLLSPAQYPWYAMWFLPLLPLFPLRGFLVLTATLPLYYAFFHFNARDQPEVFRSGLVWAIWVPAWAALGLDWARRDRQPPRPAATAPVETAPVDPAP